MKGYKCLEKEFYDVCGTATKSLSVHNHNGTPTN